MGNYRRDGTPKPYFAKELEARASKPRRKRRTRAEIERDRIAALGIGEQTPGGAGGPNGNGSRDIDGESQQPAGSGPAAGGSESAGEGKAEAEAAQIVVEGGAPLTPEENAAREKRLAAAKAYKLRKKAEAAGGQDEQTVLMLLTILDGLATAALGPDAALLPFEREMIEGPAKRILARFDEGTKGIIDKWADPITLIVGLAFWGNRLASLASDQKKARERAAPNVEYKPPIPAEPVAFVVPDQGPAMAPPPDSIVNMVQSDSISGPVGQGVN